MYLGILGAAASAAGWLEGYQCDDGDASHAGVHRTRDPRHLAHKNVGVLHGMGHGESHQSSASSRNTIIILYTWHNASDAFLTCSCIILHRSCGTARVRRSGVYSPEIYQEAKVTGWHAFRTSAIGRIGRGTCSLPRTPTAVVGWGGIRL